jgi:hypothetical protein
MTCCATLTEQFTQTDPMPRGVGSTFESAYVYVSDLPTVMTDPSGLRGMIPNELGFDYSRSYSGGGPKFQRYAVSAGSTFDVNPLLVNSIVLSEATGKRKGISTDTGIIRGLQILCESFSSDSRAKDDRCDTYGVTNLRAGEIQDVWTSQASNPRVAQALSNFKGVGWPYNYDGLGELFTSVVDNPNVSIGVSAAYLRVLDGRIPKGRNYFSDAQGNTVSRSELLLLNGSDGNLVALASEQPLDRRALANQLSLPRNQKYLAAFRGYYAASKATIR